MLHILIFGDLFDSTNIKIEKRRLFNNGDVYDGFGLILKTEESIEEITREGRITNCEIISQLTHFSTRVSQKIEFRKHRGGGIEAGFYTGIIGKHKPSAVSGHKAILICNKEKATLDKLKKEKWKFFINDGAARELKVDFISEIHKKKLAYAINLHRGPNLGEINKKNKDWNWSYGCLTSPKDMHDIMMKFFDYDEKITIHLIRERRFQELEKIVEYSYPSISNTLLKIISEVQQL